MNGPNARVLREGGIGGSLPYKTGTTLLVRLVDGGLPPPEWKRKTTLQGIFGEFGQILRIDIQEVQGAAYVEYDDKRDAEDALRDLVGKRIAGREVHIQMAHSPLQLSPTARSVDVEERIAIMARAHRLDEAASARLVSVFAERGRLGCDLAKDCEEFSQHLAASNKPSALVSMKLAELRAGRPIGPCKYRGGGLAPGALGLRLDRGIAEDGRSGREEGRRRGDAGSCADSHGSGRHSPSREQPKTSGRASGSRGASRGRSGSRRKGAASSSRSHGKKPRKRRKSGSSSRARSSRARGKTSAKKRRASSPAASTSRSSRDSPAKNKDRHKKHKGKKEKAKR